MAHGEGGLCKSDEEVYLRDYESVTAAMESLACYFAFYNQERLHQSLDYETPASVYFGQCGETDRAQSHNSVSSPAMAGELLATPLLVGGMAGG